MHMHF